MRISLPIGSLLAAIALTRYLLILFLRTDWFDRTAAVSVYTVGMVIGLCAVGLVLAVAGIVLEAQPRWLPTMGLVLNGVLSAVYAILYAIGKFGPVGLKS
jgi:hypothetical protein